MDDKWILKRKRAWRAAQQYLLSSVLSTPEPSTLLESQAAWGLYKYVLKRMTSIHAVLRSFSGCVSHRESHLTNKVPEPWLQ